MAHCVLQKLYSHILIRPSNPLLLLSALFLFSSCASLKIGNRSELESGFYKTRAGEEVYIDEDEAGFIHVYREDEAGRPEWQKALKPKGEAGDPVDSLFLRKNSFDLDLISIPIKLMPATRDLPAQLSTNLSAALFMGLRRDFHRITYEKNPLGDQIRKVSNIGFSAGLISGFGNTPVNETTTAGAQHKEYDGIVWMYGADAIVGWNDLTFGLAIGKDVLLDSNRSNWIYKGKWWYGLTIGLNLN